MACGDVGAAGRQYQRSPACGTDIDRSGSCAPGPRPSPKEFPMTAIPLLAALLSLQSVSFSPSTAQFRAHPPPQTVPPDAYVVDFAATAARGVARNDVGVGAVATKSTT